MSKRIGWLSAVESHDATERRAITSGEVAS
jgi:hypothetical protein